MTTTYTTPNGQRIKIHEVYWIVTGSKGDQYRVTRYPDGDYRCTCPARRVCYHIRECDAGKHDKPRVRATVIRPMPVAWAHLETAEY